MITKFKLYEKNAFVDRIYNLIYYLDYLKLQEYIKKDGILKSKEDFGTKPLLYYSVDVGSSRTTQILLDSGQFTEKEINQQYDLDGKTALIVAAEKGLEKTTRELINAGANPDIQDYNGYTAIMIYRDQSIFDLLIEISDWSIKDKEGNDILTLISTNKRKRLIEKYPEKYREYMKAHNVKKFKI